ncbi:hypothetical protein [Lysinibacillus sp. FSL M8-0134]|uniref:hypothetical protein n=1 Tax=Lysinibacillus sp. FSL M8-0134 TaxID=2921717 RepID=UPI0031197846
MNRRMLIGLLLSVGCLYIASTDYVYANESDSPQPLEEFLPTIGYKTVEAALKEFEQYNKTELKLPLKVPPISFTHRFGRFNQMNGHTNLEIVMMNDQLPQNHFKIDIRPVQDKMPFEKYVTDVFLLKNGREAAYIENPRIGFHLLVFERDNWQYVFSIDSDVADQVPVDVLLDLANSINDPKSN